MRLPVLINYRALADVVLSMSENQSGPTQSNPISGPAGAPDADGEAQISAADSPFQLSQEPLGNDPAASSGIADDTPGGAFVAPAYEHLGELPASYGTQSVYLVAYDPRQLFAYWDLDPSEAADKKYSLRTCRPDGEVEAQVDIQPTEAGHYLAASRPGGTYYVELGSYSRNHTWQVLAASGRVTLPAEGLASEAEPKFATLPFHLSFQRLLELIEGAVGSREDLTVALSRLQHGERPAVSSMLGALSRLSSDQFHTLEMVLGHQPSANSESSSPASTPVQFFRDRYEAAHGSPGMSSDLFSRTGASGSESLSSFSLSSQSLPVPLGSKPLSSLGGGLSSEALFSGGSNSGALSSGGFGSDTLLSLLSGLSSDTLSSFFTFLAGDSETLSSGILGAGMNSEAWRMVGSSPGFSSGDLSSERAEVFLHAVENNLGVLGSLFSHTSSSSSSGSNFGGDSSSPNSFGSTAFSSPAGNSESVAKKKSLW